MLGDETDGFLAWQRQHGLGEERAPGLEGVPLAGELVAKATAKLGIDRFVKYVADQLGEECGCETRRVKLNALDSRLRRWLGMG